LNEARVQELVAARAVAVEDLHALRDEPALFHLLNLAQERGLSLLMTSRLPQAGMRIALPDLASRLRATPMVAVGAPDDDLLRRVLVKLFADRQLVVDLAVLDYIVKRMERSLSAAGRIVDLLDHTALAEGRRITRALAAEALATEIK
jgi:chromosomal replication initiation ATPase DnaA